MEKLMKALFLSQSFLCVGGPWHVFLLKESEQGKEKTADTIKQRKPLHCI
jgi:hypothetical protein